MVPAQLWATQYMKIWILYACWWDSKSEIWQHLWKNNIAILQTHYLYGPSDFYSYCILFSQALGNINVGEELCQDYGTPNSLVPE